MTFVYGGTQTQTQNFTLALTLQSDQSVNFPCFIFFKGTMETVWSLDSLEFSDVQDARVVILGQNSK